MGNRGLNVLCRQWDGDIVNRKGLVWVLLCVCMLVVMGGGQI